MKSLVYLTLLFILCACSSSGKLKRYPRHCPSIVYNKVKNDSLKGIIGFYSCGINKDGKFLSGLRSQSNGSDGGFEWVIQPEYKTINGLNSNIFFVKRHGDEYYSILNIKENSEKKTNYRNIAFLETGGASNSNGTPYFRGLIPFEGNKIFILNRVTGQEIKTIENVDSTRKYNNFDLKAYYTSSEGGLIVRHNENGSQYYVVYDSEGKPLTSKISSKDIALNYYSTRSGNRILFSQKIKSSDLYWPLVFDYKSIIEKPSHIKGAYIENLRDMQEIPKNSKSSYLDIGSEIYYQSNNKVISISLYDSSPYLFRDRLINNFDKYESLSNIASLTILPESKKPREHSRTKKTEIVIGPEILFQSKSGDYYLEKPKKNFKSKSLAMNYLKERTQNFDKIVSDLKNQESQRSLAKAAQQKASYEAKKIADKRKRESFMHKIETSGPDTSSALAYGREVDIYCAYGGRKCQELKKQARNRINSHNRNAQQKNNARLNDLYNGETAYEKQKRIKYEQCRKRANTLNRHAGKRAYSCN